MVESVTRMLFVSVLLCFVTSGLSEERHIRVVFDLTVRSGLGCEPLEQGKPNYWTEERFSECDPAPDEGQTRAFGVSVDLTKLPVDQSKLPEGFFEWVINRQLNLDTNICATLVGPFEMPESSSTFSVAYPVADQSKIQSELNNNLPVGITVSAFNPEEGSQRIHGTTVKVADLTLSGTITRVQYLQTLRKLNNFPRCRYNMFAK